MHSHWNLPSGVPKPRTKRPRLFDLSRGMANKRRSIGGSDGRGSELVLPCLLQFQPDLADAAADGGEGETLQLGGFLH